MILINLLPHREARRQQRKQAFYAGLALAALAGAAGVFVWYTVLGTLTRAQDHRNEFLSGEIKHLDSQIAEVKSLKDDIEKLKARQKAVEDLQADRNMPVYLLNELVKQTPEGVYLTAVHQTGQQVAITGVAQTNERVAEFLRNAGSSDPANWFEKPQLGPLKSTTVAVGNNKDQRRMAEFAMGVTLKRPPAPGASAPAGGASGVLPVAASAPAVKK